MALSTAPAAGETVQVDGKSAPEPAATPDINKKNTLRAQREELIKDGEAKGAAIAAEASRQQPKQKPKPKVAEQTVGQRRRKKA